MEPVWLHFKAQSLKIQRVLQVRSQMGQVPIYTASIVLVLTVEDEIEKLTGPALPQGLTYTL